MLKLTRYDAAILCAMYGYAPTRSEIEADIADRYRGRSGGMKLREFKRRLYRLSRHGLCGGDTPDMHPGQPICWSLSPAGGFIVEAVDGTDWDNDDFVYEYVK